MWVRIFESIGDIKWIYSVSGPKKLPEIGRSLGKAIRGFQDASQEFQEEFKKEAAQIEEAVKTTAELEPKLEGKVEKTEEAWRYNLLLLIYSFPYSSYASC